MIRKLSVPKPIPFTKKGYQNLLNEQKILQKERLVAVSELQRAREMGDLKENGFYRGAKFKLISIDRRLRELTYLIRYGKVIEQIQQINTINIGSEITVKEGESIRKFILVGEFEANPLENKLSHKSPIGRELLGKKVGETVIIRIPSGEVTYKVLSISLP